MPILMTMISSLRKIERVSLPVWLTILIPVLYSRDWCLLVAASLAAGSVLAQAGQFGDYAFESSGSGVTIISYTGPGGHVIIPGVIDDQPVTGIGDFAFWDCTNLTSVVIPSSVAGIDRGAFEGCASLAAIEVDPGNPAYSSWDGVLLDKNLKSLIRCPVNKTGAYSIPDGVTSIGSFAFGFCSSLAGVSIPDSVTSIGEWAFAGCSRLVNVTIPERVARIEISTFRDCASLVNIAVPSGVESVGSQAFAGCINLTHIAIPESVTYFDTNRVGGVDSFLGCTGLSAIEVNSQNPVFSSLNGVLLDKAETTVILYPGGKQGAYSVPSSVASIGPMAFNDCAGLTCITIPDSVTTIGYSAFSGCINLSSVIIPESVTDIGHWAFHDCANLTRFYCGGAAPTLGAGVFYGATNTTVHFLPATTGWAPTFGERPTALWVPIMPLPSAPGDYLLKLVTHSPAPTTVRVQRSTNLVDWEDWQTVSRDAGPSELQDSEAITTPYRYYRGIEE